MDRPSPSLDRIYQLGLWSAIFFAIFLRLPPEQISPDSAGPFTSFDPVGFAIFATLRAGSAVLQFYHYYAVPGAMIAVPLASPSGIGPASCSLNNVSSCCCDIASSCLASHAMDVTLAWRSNPTEPLQL